MTRKSLNVDAGVVLSAAWLSHSLGKDKLARQLLMHIGIETLVDLNMARANQDDKTKCEMLW